MGDQIEFLMTPQSSLNWIYTAGVYHWPNSFRRVFINSQMIKDGAEPLIICPNTEMSSTLYELKL